jgi:hypothetical protein
MITMAGAGKVMLVRFAALITTKMRWKKTFLYRDHGMHWKKIEKMCSIKNPSYHA